MASLSETLLPAPVTLRRAQRARVVLWGLVVLLVVVILLSLDKGALEIPARQIFAICAQQIGWHLPYEFTVQQEVTLLSIRLPRVLLGLLVGAGMGVAGALLQGLFRNPLADPGLIGVSSGAALAASLVIIAGDLVSFSAPLWAKPFILPLGAFAGGVAMTLLVYRLATTGGQTLVTTMLLAGIAINALAQAGSGTLTFFATDTQIRSLTFWRLGSLSGTSWKNVMAAAPFLLACIVIGPRFARALNALALGEAEAGHLGVNVQRAKRLTIALASLAVGASVAMTGLIGFVGLIVPHLLRLLVGPDHRYVLPGAALLGASLLVLADLLARTIVAPAEMPIGILTALAGAPFFLWLLLRDRRNLMS